MPSSDLPKPDYAHQQHASSATAIRAAAAMECRSWCIAATPIRPHFLERLHGRRRARPEQPEGGEIRRRAAGTLDAPPGDDLLLVIHNKDMFAQPELADEKNYYKGFEMS